MSGGSVESGNGWLKTLLSLNSLRLTVSSWKEALFNTNGADRPPAEPVASGHWDSGPSSRLVLPAESVENCAYCCCFSCPPNFAHLLTESSSSSSSSMSLYPVASLPWTVAPSSRRISKKPSTGRTARASSGSVIRPILRQPTRGGRGKHSDSRNFPDSAAEAVSKARSVRFCDASNVEASISVCQSDCDHFIDLPSARERRILESIASDILRTNETTIKKVPLTTADTARGGGAVSGGAVGKTATPPASNTPQEKPSKTKLHQKEKTNLTLRGGGAGTPPPVRKRVPPNRLPTVRRISLKPPDYRTNLVDGTKMTYLKRSTLPFGWQCRQNQPTATTKSPTTKSRTKAAAASSIVVPEDISSTKAQQAAASLRSKVRTRTFEAERSGFIRRYAGARKI